VPADTRRRLTLLAMCIATLMIQLDVAIVTVALPSIQRDLQVTPGALEWVISGYALSLAAWSPLRTGLSWLFMNAPLLLAAQLTGRLDRRLPVALVIAVGCVAGAAGVFALSMIGPTTSLIVTAVGYLLCGAGFGVPVPGVTHVAMRDVPADISGAASRVLNASRQLGTSAGLAVLATLGMASAISNWKTAARPFPAAIRAAAMRQAQNVGGARISAVTRALGGAYRQPAAQSFVHGYHLAVGVGAACLLAAAVIAVLGFRGQSEAGACSSSSTSMPLGARTFTTR
jgi:MFS family permease